MKKFKLIPKKNKFNTGNKVMTVLLSVMILSNIFNMGYESYHKYVLSSTEKGTEVPKLILIKEMLEKYYLFSDKIPEQAMVDGAINGMIDSLGDPYAMYISDKDYKDFKIETEGSFGGIGVTINSSESTDGLVISSTEEGLGASIAGLKENDKIISIDGEDIKGKDLDESIDKIRGEVGTNVTLLVEREGEKEPIQVVVERKQVDLPYVSYNILKDDIGYIYYKQFSNSSIEQFDEAYNALKNKGIKSLILDLRSNPGGLVDVSIQLASRFLGENKTVLFVEGKNYKLEEKTIKTDYVIDIPVVLLINESSASASEILAGSLKDNSRAYLIGNTTYGKGLIQETVPINDTSALIMTISQYLTPSGNDIHGIGVKPDKQVLFSIDDYRNGKDSQLEEAIDYLLEN